MVGDIDRFGDTCQVKFILLHSPVVGPSTWKWVAEALRDAGSDVVVPDLVSAALSGDPMKFAETAVGMSGSGDAVLVGHSGSGALLPLISEGLVTRPSLTVFVDAGLPPCEGSFTAGGNFLGTLRELSKDGILPRWSDWWAPDVLESLVPDDDKRGVVERELPEIPLRFYESLIEVPEGWCARSGAYVLLSEGYHDDANSASVLGWPVVTRLGQHLDIVCHSEAIADILLQISTCP
jgi:hypothetical protein